jgi:predicted nucleic acid-binding protein
VSFIVDTTGLSNLAAIGRLDILRQIFGVLYHPLDVYSEVEDRAARSEAAGWGVQCSGTIGCLVAAVERGLSSIDEANAWLRDMVAHGYRSPLPDITALIKGEDLG